MKLAIYNSGIHMAFGKIVYADNIHHLLADKMSKKDKETWELVKYRDENGRVVCITREFIDEQGMSLDEVIADWKANGQKDFPDDDIPCFPRKYSSPCEPVYL